MPQLPRRLHQLGLHFFHLTGLQPNLPLPVQHVLDGGLGSSVLGGNVHHALTRRQPVQNRHLLGQLEAPPPVGKLFLYPDRTADAQLHALDDPRADRMVPVVILGRNGSQGVPPQFGRVAVQRVTTGSGKVQPPELTVVGLADVFDGRGHAGTEL
uniref:(northern house mosquito) hypothetical protein n=1 Tax=Culex pipiens TaxID=7175 RepID=A0A8D8K506_CULPI